MSQANIVALILISVFAFGCTYSDAPSTTEPADGPVHGHAYLTQVLPMVDGLEDNLGEETLTRLFKDGWIQTERGFERSKVVDPQLLQELADVYFVFLVDDMEITVSDDGSIIFPRLPSEHATVTLIPRREGVDVEDEAFHAHHISTALVRDGDNINIEIAWDKIAQDHDGHAGHGAAKNLPCLDYNGWMGNCDPGAGGWRKYRNFIESDCYWSWYWWGFCWFDHGDHRFCNGTTRNCSGLIFHSSRHHCH